jgi:hypothetical protein
MSKVDAQRAMREARYAAYRASCAAADAPETKSPPTPARVTRTKPLAAPDSRAIAAAVGQSVIPAPIEVRADSSDDAGARAAVQVSPAAPAEPASLVVPADPNGVPGLCGHRNIGGRSCRRPAGHAEKNHRYR